MEGGEPAGACPWWGGGGRRGGGVAPTRRNLKERILSEEILTSFSFTYVLLMKLWGNRYTIHAKWKGGRTGACSWEGGRGGLAPPPPRNGKKRLSEEILTSFTYVLLKELYRSTNTSYMQNGRGWADRRLSMVGGGGGRGGFTPPRK